MMEMLLRGFDITLLHQVLYNLCVSVLLISYMQKCTCMYMYMHMNIHLAIVLCCGIYSTCTFCTFVTYAKLFDSIPVLSMVCASVLFTELHDKVHPYCFSCGKDRLSTTTKTC